MSSRTSGGTCLENSFAEYRDLVKFGIPPAQHGIVDMFAMHMMVEHAPGGKFEVVVPPRILLGKSAGFIYRALESALDWAWSLAALDSMDVEVILLLDNADSASQMRKAMLWLGKHASAKTLHIANRCAVHQIFRCIVVVLERLKLIQGTFCITNTLHVGSKQNTFRHALATIVSGDLDSGGYLPGVAPPALDSEHRQRNRMMIDKLLVERITRAEFGCPLNSPSTEEVEKRATCLVEALQACWSLKKMLHYCVHGCACGGSKQSAIGYIVELLVWLCCTLMPETPAFSRCRASYA